MMIMMTMIIDQVLVESPFRGGTNSLSVRLPLTRTSTRYQHVQDISTRRHAVLCRLQTTPLPPPALRSYRQVPIRLVVFFVPDQPKSSLLIRVLLQIGGIEQNPGPMPAWTCAVCNGTINRGHTSVLFSRCNGWCNIRQTLNCSQLS